MPSYLRRTIPEFLQLSESEVLSSLVSANAQQRFPLTPEALDAWALQLPTLNSALTQLLAFNSKAKHWQILLEYPIPQVGKRIDAVLIAGDTIIVIETKTGTSPTAARRQVEDYAIALACFHEPSVGKRIVPVVVSDSHTGRSSENSQYETLIDSTRVTNSVSFGQELILISSSVNDRYIDPVTWDNGLFRPIPSIIDAAVKLYAGMDVFEIGHAAAARGDLSRTTDALLAIAKQAKKNGDKAICFVTGVPGAGKTLVGLNAVHHTSLKNVSMFLSGNGPLVKIIREALIRDVVKREGVTRRSAETTLHAFVANVHRFADDHSRPDAPAPTRNVIVFDEAQRAWDQEQNSRPSRTGKSNSRPPVSEPHMLLDIMNRRHDWAVVVALIGGGQEINRGEAGLSEWGRALQSFPSWKVYASDEVITGTIKSNGFCLYSTPDSHPERVSAHDDLHLKISTRSIRAQRISEWVDALLSGEPNRAGSIAATLAERPFIVRELDETKRWLSDRRKGFTRSGLVCSAAASRLRADGLEPSYDFHRFYEWERWFLDRSACEEVECDHLYCRDVRASSKLEVCATQFEIQGLELDWIGLCWGEDFVWDGMAWISQRFNNKYWRPVDVAKLKDKSRITAEQKHTYRLNAYRVLLTRARQGLIIYVPKPDLDDSSRSHQLLNSTYEYLVTCGAVPLK